MSTDAVVALSRTEALQAKVRVLHESLPWIQRFAGRCVVVKYGGAALAAGPLRDSFVRDIVLLRAVGVQVVVVHGGGPAVSQAMREAGHEPMFVNGQRVTDAVTLQLVRKVLVGQVNKDIVAHFTAQGYPAVGISGEDAMLVRARPRRDPSGADLGFVGDVEATDVTVLQALASRGLIPVVASLAVGPKGQPYNVNADAVAGALAVALQAEKVVYLTDVEGLYEDYGMPSQRLLGNVDVARLEALLATGTVHAGMVPKVSSAISSVRAGVGAAHILDGRLEHVMLLELFTDEGVGTMVTAEGPA